MRTLLAVLVIVAAVYGAPASYESYRNYSVFAATDAHLQLLLNWEQSGKYDFLTRPVKDGPTDIRIPEQDVDIFEAILIGVGMDFRRNDLIQYAKQNMSKDSKKSYSVFAATDAHLQLLLNWEQSGKYEFLTRPVKDGPTDIRIPASDVDNFEATCISVGMDFRRNDLIQYGKQRLSDDGYKSYSVFAVTDAHLQILLNWEQNGKYQFLTRPVKDGPTDIRIRSQEVDTFEAILISIEMDFIRKD